MSSNARRAERRREQDAEYERAQQIRARDEARRAALSTRSLLDEATGFTDEQQVFFTRLLDLFDKLGLDTYDN